MKNYLIPGLPDMVRNILGGVLALIGIYIGLMTNINHKGIIGFIIVVVAGLFLWKKNFSNAPSKKELNKTTWENVSDEKLAEIEKVIIKCKKSNGDVLPFKTIVVIGVILLFVSFYLLDKFKINGGDPIGFAFFISFSFSFLLFAVFGTGKTEYFYSYKLLQAIKQQKNIQVLPGWTVEKSVEIATEPNVPMDTKIMLKNSAFNDDFLGVQVQTSMNNGPSGLCPYTYCVVLANKSLNIIEKYKNEQNVFAEERTRKRIIENATKANEDVSVLVVRKDGYETNTKEIQALVDLAIQIATLVNQ